MAVTGGRTRVREQPVREPRRFRPAEDKFGPSRLTSRSAPRELSQASQGAHGPDGWARLTRPRARTDSDPGRAPCPLDAVRETELEAGLSTTRPLRPAGGRGRHAPERISGTGQGAATAAGRVLAVLDAFGPAHATLTLSEISRRAGLSLTTTHRLVGELRAWGALERGEDGRYGIGLRLLELGALAPHGLQLRELAVPYLDDLHQVTRANVVLGVRDGADVVYVEALRARGAVRLMSRIGGRWPLHATGTGQVLLAFAGPEVQEEVLGGPLRRFTPHTITDPAVLRRTLAEVR